MVENKREKVPRDRRGRKKNLKITSNKKRLEKDINKEKKNLRNNTFSTPLPQKKIIQPKPSFFFFFYFSQNLSSHTATDPIFSTSHRCHILSSIPHDHVCKEVATATTRPQASHHKSISFLSNTNWQPLSQHQHETPIFSTQSQICPNEPNNNQDRVPPRTRSFLPGFL